MAHRNARLTVYGRRLLIQRVVESPEMRHLGSNSKEIILNAKKSGSAARNIVSALMNAAMTSTRASPYECRLEIGRRAMTLAINANSSAAESVAM